MQCLLSVECALLHEPLIVLQLLGNTGFARPWKLEVKRDQCLVHRQSAFWCSVTTDRGCDGAEFVSHCRHDRHQLYAACSTLTINMNAGTMLTFLQRFSPDWRCGVVQMHVHRDASNSQNGCP